MDPLSATASIIAILQLSAKILAYLNDVKDASKGQAQCAIEASNIHNLLTNLRFRLEEGHAHQPWFNAVQALAVENGPLDQFKQALETLQVKMTDGGRLKNALIWKFKKEEMDAILTRKERLKTLTEIALQMDHFKISQAIKGDTDSIRTHVSAIQSTVDKVQREQVTFSQRTLLEWISSSDYPTQHSDIIKRRQEGTGQWFLDAPKVVRWPSEAKATLFCPGIPGACKTIVAAIAIDYLLNAAQNSAYGVAYIYCNYKSQADQDTASLLAAILKQLGQGRPSTLGPVERLHQKHASRGTRPSLDDAFSALQDAVAQYAYVFIVVDALDECQREVRGQLLHKLLALQKEADVRILATSRFVLDVEDALQQALRLEIKASDEDVKEFVVGQIYRLPKYVQRNTALQDLVQEKVVEAVDGMFLLARLHIDALSGKTTTKAVKLYLATISEGEAVLNHADREAALNHAYREALERIEGQQADHSRLAKHVLSWITFAKRPLTTAEICCALAVESDEAEIDLENKPDVEDLLSVCAGLVIVDQESAVIRLVHYTTQKYFESTRSYFDPDPHLLITETCLTYLSFSVFESGSCATDKDFEERLHQHELLEYAARNCGEHARCVEAKVAERVCSFLTNDSLLVCAAQVLYVEQRYKDQGYSQDHPVITGLHWAARFGLCAVAERYLGIAGEYAVHAVNAADSRGEYSLMYASEHEHYEMAKLLLNKGADVNAQGGYTSNALQAASSNGHEAVVKLLLDKGANVNAQDRYGNALQEASSGGHEAVVKLLLDKGADVNAQGGYYGNALQAASSGGYEAVVKLLLDRGADVNAQGSYALHAASSGGYEAVVKLLLDKGADVNAQGEYDGNALYKASSRGHEAVVKLLLDRGADVNAQGSYALYAASSGGYEAVIKLLLDKGADVNAQDGYYGNALQAASSGGYERVVKLLLDKGADVNVQGGRYGNALQAASSGGYEIVVKLLLDKGTDVNVQGGRYGNALQAASFKGYKAVVKLLLDKGANVNAQGSNALQAALSGSYKAVVKLLLDKGANVSSVD